MNILFSPYPLELNFKKSLKLSLLVGFFVFFFLYVFQPAKSMFSYDAMNISSAIIYGGITFMVMFFFYHVLLLWFPSIFVEEKWTLLKGIIQHLLMFLVITIFNFLFSIIGKETLEVNYLILDFLRLLMITMSIAIFPTIAIIFYNQYNLLKQYLVETESINKVLQNKENLNENVILIGEGKNEKFNLTIDDLFFIQSQGNYIEIFLKNAENIVLRSSLIKINHQISSNQIYKCHRSYLVNLSHVKNVTGNAQGLRLHFEGIEESVPVSRSLTSEIKQLLLHYHS